MNKTIARAALPGIFAALIALSACQQKPQPRGIDIAEVAISGAWKDCLQVEPGYYTLENGEKNRALISLRLVLTAPFKGKADNPARTFALTALSKGGAEMGITFSVVSEEKFNDLVRGKPGDAAAITFRCYRETNKGDWFRNVAGFDGKTLADSVGGGKTASAPAPSAPAPSTPAPIAPRNTGADPVFNPRTEARVGGRIVAVPELTATQSIGEDIAIGATSAVTTGLVENKNINRVIDYNQINRIMKQHRFEAGDWSNPAKYAEIGKALNVDTIAVGEITVGDSFLGMKDYVLSVRLIDISTMAVAGSFTVKSPNLAYSGQEEAKKMKVTQ